MIPVDTPSFLMTGLIDNNGNDTSNVLHFGMPSFDFRGLIHIHNPNPAYRATTRQQI